MRPHGLSVPRLCTQAYINLTDVLEVWIRVDGRLPGNGHRLLPRRFTIHARQHAPSLGVPHLGRGP